MARPNKSEHTKERLIEQGIQILSEQGYHGTGIKQILDAVKVPKGSFYNYFGSKEAFAAEIIDTYSMTAIEHFEAFVEGSSDDPVTIIKQLYGLLIDYFEQQDCERGCLIGSMAAEIGGSSDVCQQSLQNTVTRWRDKFIALIERGQHEGYFRNDLSAHDLSDLFWNVWEGGILRMKIEGNSEPLKRALDQTLDNLFKPS